MKFEIECCQLQKLDITEMTLNERTLFFTNIHNMLMAHGVIRRGAQGTTMVDRQSFQRSVKYNVGGHIFAATDIKYGILRSAACAPVVMGPLVMVWNFGDRDTRKQFGLEESRPEITFCLFQASATSPSLVVFHNPNTIVEDMKASARVFLSQSIYFDARRRTILLPELFRVYWADFGKTKHEVLKYVASIAGTAFADKMRTFFATVGKGKIRVDFIPFDWTPMFIIPNRTAL